MDIWSVRTSITLAVRDHHPTSSTNFQVSVGSNLVTLSCSLSVVADIEHRLHTVSRTYSLRPVEIVKDFRRWRTYQNPGFSGLHTIDLYSLVFRCRWSESRSVYSATPERSQQRWTNTRQWSWRSHARPQLSRWTSQRWWTSPWSLPWYKFIVWKLIFHSFVRGFYRNANVLHFTYRVSLYTGIGMNTIVNEIIWNRAILLVVFPVLSMPTDGPQNEQWPKVMCVLF